MRRALARKKSVNTYGGDAFLILRRKVGLYILSTEGGREKCLRKRISVLGPQRSSENLCDNSEEGYIH